MLTTVSFPSLILGRLPLHPTLDSSASLTRGHVVGLKAELESGTFLTGQLFQGEILLRYFIDPEETMEQST
jgi:hypothetical protein